MKFYCTKTQYDLMWDEEEDIVIYPNGTTFNIENCLYCNAEMTGECDYMEDRR